MFNTGMTLVNKPEDIVVGSWVIIIFDKINQDTGYNSSDSVDHLVVYSTIVKSVWEAAIQKHELTKMTAGYNWKKYVAFHVDSVASVQTLITVNVK